jgi:hypothetical protein
MLVEANWNLARSSLVMLAFLSHRPNRQPCQRSGTHTSALARQSTTDPCRIPRIG